MPADAERLGDILARAVVRPAKRNRSMIARARRKWASVAGEEIVAHAGPRSVRRGVLTVEVDSSALLAELAGYQQRDLLRALAGEPQPLGIRELKFVLAEGAE